MNDNVILNEGQRLAVQKYALMALREFDVLCKKNSINYTLGYGTLIGAIRHKGFIPWDDDIDVCVTRKDLAKLREFANNELPVGYFYQTNKTDNNWFRLYDKIRVDGTIFREIAHENENIHQGVYIDVFPLDFMPSSAIVSTLHFKLYKIISAILSAKFISLRQRHGFNKLLSCIIKYLLYPINKRFLYNIAEKLSSYYKDGEKYRNYESPYGDTIPKSSFERFTEVTFENEHFMSIKEYDKWLRETYGDYMKLPPLEKRVTRHSLSELKL